MVLCCDPLAIAVTAAAIGTAINYRHPGNLRGEVFIEDYALLLTPQNRGSGACTMPLTFLRQA
jgi:hypothetical protein